MAGDETHPIAGAGVRAQNTGSVAQQGQQPRQQGQGRQLDERGKQLEAILSTVFVALILILWDALLFGPNRASQDGADIVTLCAVGGAAIVLLRSDAQARSRTLAGIVLGIVGGVAAFHGGRDEIELSAAAKWVFWHLAQLNVVGVPSCPGKTYDCWQMVYVEWAAVLSAFLFFIVALLVQRQVGEIILEFARRALRGAIYLGVFVLSLIVFFTVFYIVVTYLPTLPPKTLWQTPVVVGLIAIVTASGIADFIWWLRNPILDHVTQPRSTAPRSPTA